MSAKEKSVSDERAAAVLAARERKKREASAAAAAPAQAAPAQAAPAQAASRPPLVPRPPRAAAAPAPAPADNTLDLSPIGIEFTITATTTMTELLRNLKGFEVDISNLKSGYIDDDREVHRYLNETPTQTSYLTMNRNNYHICTYLGGGSYGKVYMVRNNVDRKAYALKVQECHNKGERKIAYLEGVVNFILSSKVGELVPKIYGISHVKHEGTFIVYTLIEYLEGMTVSSSISSVLSKEAHSKLLLRKMATALKTINSNGFNFTHGDFKEDNCMISGDSIKLIDFGFTRIVFNSIEFVLNNDYNSKYSKGRDLTHMIYMLFHYTMSGTDQRNYLSDFLKFNYDGKEHDLTKKYSNDMDILYDFFNTIDNTKTWPDNFLAHSGGKRFGPMPHRFHPRSHKSRSTRKLNGSRKVKVTLRSAKKTPRTMKYSGTGLSAEFSWHANRDHLTPEALTAKIEANGIHHASQIASTYLNEKDSDLQLNLLRTMLFFHEAEEGAFADFLQRYEAMEPKDRKYLVNEIHWNAKVLDKV